MKNSSKHFKEIELHCRCGCGTKGMQEELLREADGLRDEFGPLTVTSARRCEASNKAAGGASKSQHLIGNALDLAWGNMSGVEKRRLLALAMRRFSGIGIHKQFLHVDCRPGPQLVFFY